MPNIPSFLVFAEWRWYQSIWKPPQKQFCQQESIIWQACTRISSMHGMIRLRRMCKCRRRVWRNMRSISRCIAGWWLLSRRNPSLYRVCQIARVQDPREPSIFMPAWKMRLFPKNSLEFIIKRIRSILILKEVNNFLGIKKKNEIMKLCRI